MAGKMCVGESTNQSYLLKETKAFAEGLLYRATGTAVTHPNTHNPFDGDGTTAEKAWDNGWVIASLASPDPIDPADAPCVAVPANPVLP